MTHDPEIGRMIREPARARALAAAVLLVSALAAAACGGATDRGERALARGELEMAEAHARRVLAEDPADREAALLLTDVFLATARWPQAAEVLAGFEAQGDRPADDVARRVLRLAEATGDDQAWADAWIATFATHGGALAAPTDLAVATRVVRRIVRRDLAAAMILARGMLAADGDGLARSAVEGEVDGYLYTMSDRGQARESATVRVALEGLLGECFVLDKHAVIADLVAGDSQAAERFAALVEGDPDAMSGLAVEFVARGAHAAAVAAFRIVATRSPGRAAAAYRAAAEAAYIVGDRDEARRLLELSVADPLTAPEAMDAAHRVAVARYDAGHRFAFAQRAADGACAGADPAAVTSAVLILAQADLEDGDSDAAAALAEAHASSGCGDAGLNARTGFLLAASEHPGLAEPFLLAALLARPTELDLLTAYLDAAAESWDPIRVSTAVDAHTAALHAGGTEYGAERYLATLQTLRRHRLHGAAIALLGPRVEADPSDFSLAAPYAELALALGQGEVADRTLSRFVEASDEPLRARLVAGRWLAAHGEQDRAIAWLRALATDPGARAMPTLDGADDTVAAAAWRVALGTAPLDYDRIDETLELLRAFIEASGPDAPDTWAAVWERPAIVDALPAWELVELGEQSVAAGYAPAEVHVALGRSYLGTGDRVAASEAFATAALADPPRVAALATELEARNADDVALAMWSAYADRFGEGRRVLLALAETHGREATRVEDPELRRRHLAGAHRALRRFFEGGHDPATVSIAALRRAELYALAAELALARLEPGDADDRLSIVRDLASSGAADEILVATLADAPAKAELQNIGDTWRHLADEGYFEIAADLVETQLTRSASDPVAWESLADSAASVVRRTGDHARYRRFVERTFAQPAELLATPFSVVPDRYVDVPDRQARAGALYRKAGRLFLDGGIWDAAEESFMRAIDLEAASSMMLAPRALTAALRARGGTFGETDLDEFVGRAGGEVTTWRVVAFSLEELERYSLASTAWARVLEMAPDDWAARTRLGAVRCALGQGDDGLAEYRAAIEIARAAVEPNALPDTVLQAVTGLEAIGRHGDALVLLEASLTGSAPDARLVLALAQRELEAGDTARALRRLSGAGRSLPPGDVVDVLARAGAWTEALDRIERELATGSPGAMARPMLAYDEAIAARRGPVVRAEWMRAAASARRPDPADPDYGTAIALAVSGHGPEATRALRSAIRNGPEWTGALDDRGLPLRIAGHRLLGAYYARAGVGDLRDDAFATYLRLLAEDLSGSIADVDLLVAELVRAGSSDAIVALFEPWIDQPGPIAALAVETFARWLRADGRLDEALALLRRHGLPGIGAGTWVAELSLAARVHESGVGRSLVSLAVAGAAPEANEVAAALASRGALPGTRVLAVAAATDDETAAAAIASVAQEAVAGHPASTLPLCDAMATSGLLDAAARCLADVGGPLRVRTEVFAQSLSLGLRSGLPSASVAPRGAVPTTVANLAEAAYRYDVAADVLAQGRRAYPSPEVLPLAAAIASYHAGRIDDVRSLVDEMLPDQTRPAAFVRRIGGAVHPTLDGGLRVELAEIAAQQAPGRMDLAVELAIARANSGDGSGAAADLHALSTRTGCDRAALGEIAERIDEAGLDEHVWAVAEIADTCADGLPSDGLLRAGGAAARRGADADAESYFARAVARAPDPHEARVSIAALWLDAGEYHRAIAAATAALAVRADIRALASRATARARLGEVADTMMDLEALVASRADLLTVLPPIMAALLAADEEAAAADLARRLSGVPGAAWLWNAQHRRGLDVALAVFADGSPAAGLRFLEAEHAEVLAYPELALAVVPVAGLHEAAGQIDAAEQVYRRGLEDDPTNPVFLNNLAYLLAEHGLRLEEAERLVRAAMANEGSPRPTTLDTLGWVQLRRGDLRAARETLAMALRLLPSAVTADVSERSFDPRGEHGRVLMEHLQAIDAALAAAGASDTGDGGRRGRRGRRSEGRRSRRR